MNGVAGISVATDHAIFVHLLEQPRMNFTKQAHFVEKLTPCRYISALSAYIPYVLVLHAIYRLTMKKVYERIQLTRLTQCLAGLTPVPYGGMEKC